jgi:hypothetical protein
VGKFGAKVGSIDSSAFRNDAFLFFGYLLEQKLLYDYFCKKSRGQMNQDNAPRLNSRQILGWFFQPDPLLGWIMNPGQVGWYVKPGIFESFVRVNDQGFRGNNFSFQRGSQKACRILVLADSFGAALEVNDQRNFSGILQQELDQATSQGRYEVINAGIGGYGTEQELLLFKERFRELEIDVVLLAFHFGDDLIENSADLREITRWRLVKLPRPYIRILQGQIQIQNYPPNPKVVNQAWRHYYDLLPWNYRALHTPPLSTAPWTFTSRLARRGFEMVNNRLDRMRKQNSAPVDLLIYQQDAGPMFEEAWQHTTELIRFLQTECAQRNVKLLASGLCTKDQTTPGYLEKRLAPYGIPHINPHFPNQQLEDIMSRLQIPYIDLTWPFIEAEKGGANLFFSGDIHWNEHGHALAGARISDFIRANE